MVDTLEIYFGNFCIVQNYESPLNTSRYKEFIRHRVVPEAMNRLFNSTVF